ncbi:MAG: alpha/beta hydrolase-fold protein [Planctomycetia bacterium]|nr:alpha/beta hydrolase-fold protein [Planctomycetia bacterium]
MMWTGLASLMLWTGDAGYAADFSEAEYGQLEKCTWEGDDGSVLPYRFYKPETKAGEKYPLIIFLHGAGERGTDNVGQLKNDQFLQLIFSDKGREHPAFLIAPQCPGGERWCEVDWGLPVTHQTPANPSRGMEKLHALLQQLKKDYPIDEKRIYVTGLSMGGYGTFDFMVRYPNEVAAAIPVCGGADLKKLREDPLVYTIPVWIFHGSADGAVPVTRSRGAYEILKTRNPDAHYTEVPEMGHNVWTVAYKTPGLIDWLFRQSK